MAEKFAKFLADLVLAVLMFIILNVFIKGCQIIWRKIRTPKDPVIA